jgi:uncharacterized protein YkwD
MMSLRPWLATLVPILIAACGGAAPTVASSGEPGSARHARGEAAPDAAAIEAEVVAETNLARTQPSLYATFLEARRPFYQDGYLRMPGRVTLRTQEGIAALDEAIAFLRHAKPLPPVTASQGLARAARDHVRDIGPRGVVSHDGRDGSSPFDRMSRYGRWEGKAGENISFGPDTAREVVLQLLVDDGVPSRGHRHNLFDPGFAKVGVAFGEHAAYRKVCVTDFAGGYSEGAK